MIILVLNCGSTWIKYALVDSSKKGLLAKGVCTQIGGYNSAVECKSANVREKPIRYDIEIPDHKEALKTIINLLCDSRNGIINTIQDIDAIGHFVKYGGVLFKDAVVVTSEVKVSIKSLLGYSPVHNPSNLIGMEACEDLFPDIPSIAVFGTAFYSDMPDFTSRYALSEELCEKHQIYRLGLDGIVQQDAEKRAMELIGSSKKGVQIVICNLGNESSVVASIDGKCFDWEPIMGSTQCGPIDPAIIPYLMKRENLAPEDIEHILNKKSGFLGLTREYNLKQFDFSHQFYPSIEAASGRDLAVNILCHQASKGIGGLAAAMGGMDALVFTGSIGCSNPVLRSRICDNLCYLGIKLAEYNNVVIDHEKEISSSESSIKVFVVPVSEEYAIAKETEKTIKNNYHKNGEHVNEHSVSGL